jgi:hypothetical protein
MTKRLKVHSSFVANTNHVRLRVHVSAVRRIIETAYADENCVVFGEGEGDRFTLDQVDYESYNKDDENGKGGFWITRTKPIRLGWTGEFPKDSRFTVTVKLTKHWSPQLTWTILEKLLLHLCRDPDGPSFMDDMIKFDCYRFMVRLHSDIKQWRGKPNPFLWALFKKYDMDPDLVIPKEILDVCLKLHTKVIEEDDFDLMFFEDHNDSEGHDDPVTSSHILSGENMDSELYHKKINDFEHVIGKLGDISLNKSVETSIYVDYVRKRERDILPGLIHSKPFEALNLITLIIQFDILFHCNFTSIIERLQTIECDMERNCSEKVVMAKFYCHFGEILTKASRFDEAQQILNKADTAFENIRHLDGDIILDKLSIKIRLGRHHLLCLRNELATSQLEQANQLIQEYKLSIDFEQERLRFKEVEVLVLSAEMELKKCNYREAEIVSRQAYRLLLGTKIQRLEFLNIGSYMCTIVGRRPNQFDSFRGRRRGFYHSTQII